MKKIIFLIFLFTFLNAKNSITIYSNDFAFVKEDINLNIKKGKQKLYFTDIADTIVIDSLYPKFSGDVKLISQEFVFKSKDFNKNILESNLNNKVEFFYEGKKYSGKLILTEPIIIKSDDKYFIIKDMTKIIFNRLPKINKDSFISWFIESKKEKNEKVELNYLINFINWKMSYIVNLQEDKLQLIGFAKINNNSKKDFKDFKINLIAGSVRKTYSSKRRVYAMKKSIALEAMPIKEEAILPKNLSGVYKYEVANKDTILNGAQKEILLIKKELNYKNYATSINSNFNNYGNKDLYFNRVIEFKNSTNLPLPSGVVRVYKDNIFLGQDEISNTIKNQKVTLTLGKYFGIKGKKSIVKYVTRRNYKNVKTKYSLTNTLNKEILVKIKEQIPRYKSKIIFKNDCKGCEIKKLNAFYREFNIKLKPNSKFNFTTEFEVFYE
jgi:hypothetical protein